MPTALPLARRLLEAEAHADTDGTASMVRACHGVLQGLHDGIRPLVGPGGFQWLLGAAALTAATSCPGLGRMAPPREGPPSPTELEAFLDPPGHAASTLVAATLTGLVRVIGRPSLLELLRSRWPTVPMPAPPPPGEVSTPPTATGARLP